MNSGLKRSALGLLLLPLLGAATGCSSSDPSPDAAGSAAASPSGSASASRSASSPSSSAGPSAAPTPSSSSSADPSAPEATGEPGVDAPADPALEAAAQSPKPAPEPTFDAPQQQFLQDKVPEGTDPNSVLQVGQEHCDRLLGVKDLDPEAVISDLITNPAQNISDAVASLCPELLPELDAAALGFPDGVFAVGAAAAHAEAPSVAPGTYRVYGMPPGCTISVYSAADALISSGDGSGPVTIGADAARVESDQCYSWFRS